MLLHDYDQFLAINDIVNNTSGVSSNPAISLQWRHNERDGVSNHRRFRCELFVQAQIKEITKAPRHLAFVSGIHRWPLNSPHKGPVTRKKFPFDDVFMITPIVAFHMF